MTCNTEPPAAVRASVGLSGSDVHVHVRSDGSGAERIWQSGDGAKRYSRPFGSVIRRASAPGVDPETVDPSSSLMWNSIGRCGAAGSARSGTLGAESSACVIDAREITSGEFSDQSAVEIGCAEKTVAIRIGPLVAESAGNIQRTRGHQG